MSEHVILDAECIDVEIVGETMLTSVEEVGVEIVEIGEPGQRGANADATFEWAAQVFELADMHQEFVLSDAPRTGSIFVYLNGLLERFWAITDSTVTLDDIALAGDTVTITYQKEI